MKRRLRSKVWWPKIDFMAENFVEKCMECTLVSSYSAPEPWQDLAIDFKEKQPGGKMLLVILVGLWKLNL